MSPDGRADGQASAGASTEAAASSGAADPTTDLTTTVAEAAGEAGLPTDGGASADAGASSGETTTSTGDDLDGLADDDLWKRASPAVRKTLKERAERDAREGWEALRKREADLAADQKKRADAHAALVAKLGTYVGDEVIKRTGRDGNEVTLPTLEEALQLNLNPRNRQKAYETYGLDEDALSDHIENLNERRAMLDGARELLRNAETARIDGDMRAGFKEVGLDLDTVLAGVTSPDRIVPAVVTHLRAAHAAEMKAQKDELEAQIGARDANAEGMRAQVLAGASRSPATGGRSAGGDLPLTPQTYAEMSYEERSKLRSTPEGRARIDAMTGRRGG